ncbi:MAG: PSD1 and planctomycete cytochrome C domain-containing protein [Planctomycetota bacterium]
MIAYRYFAALLVVAPSASFAADDIDFNRDIRPILADKCYACHGPDEAQREGGFRLDRKDSALGEADSGAKVIVPGKLEASELVVRITTADEDLVMPPADETKQLSQAEIDLLKRWVAGGANWQEHWSFVAPQKSDAPNVSRPDWIRNPIDAFILKRLDAKGLKPSTEASREALIRRVSFDLTGLPPSSEDVTAFLKDDSPNAYEKVVDRLLKSQHYGEHMARFWLDAARYGDTHGLHLDNYREIWLYRDWVINAFNQNLPFDDFTVRQLAGDLLENPSEDDLIATGFNRCHVTTSEGGSIAEEVYVRNVVDRVVTTGTVFMGMTLDCSRCHNHKYDPFTMDEFYGMFAFFNSIDGPPLDGNRKDHAPVLKVMTDEQTSRVTKLEAKLASTRAEIAKQLTEFKYTEPAQPTEAKLPEPKEFVWIDDAVPEGGRAQGNTPWQFVDNPKPVSGSKVSTRTAKGLSQHFFDGAKKPLRIGEGDKFFCYVWVDEKNPPKEIMLQWNDGSWDHRAYWGGDHIDWGKADSPSRRHFGDLPKAGEWVRLEVPADQVGLKPGSQVNGWAFTQFDGKVSWDKAGIVTLSDQEPIYDSLVVWDRDQKAAKGGTLPADIKAIVLMEVDKRNDAQQKQLLDYFVENVLTSTRKTFGPLHAAIADAEKQITDTKNSAPTTLIFREKKEPKPSYLLTRGEYDQKGDQVERRVPGILPALPEGAPMNRLGFAKWLVDRSHPLTARVTVNRMWQQVFGTGIVKTAEDFGSQGEPPSHPELLDWLAVQFQDDGWDTKQFMKRLVMSATYRQASDVTPELIEADPTNRLLARGPRFRLDAEMLRDQALVVSGLLNEKVGGPSVKPPQPDGLWFAVGYSGSNTVRFVADKGSEKVHRRTLYTFLKRTAVAPQMSTFDAPSREACTVRRERTNTPLQALLLLNDPQFIECARALAQRALSEGGDTVASRAARMLSLATSRQPADDEISVMVSIFNDLKKSYSADTEAAAKLLAIGEAVKLEGIDQAELAAWTIVANLVLNLDEVLTKG